MQIQNLTNINQRYDFSIFRQGSNGRDWNRREPVPEIRQSSHSDDENNRQFSKSDSSLRRSSREEPIRRSASHDPNSINEEDVENVIDDREMNSNHRRTGRSY